MLFILNLMEFLSQSLVMLVELHMVSEHLLNEILKSISINDRRLGSTKRINEDLSKEKN